jgi:hypothetical protein
MIKKACQVKLNKRILAHLFSDLVSYVSSVSAHQNGQIKKRHD